MKYTIDLYIDSKQGNQVTKQFINVSEKNQVGVNSKRGTSAWKEKKNISLIWYHFSVCYQMMLKDSLVDRDVFEN